MHIGLALTKDGKDIVSIKDYSNIKEKGQVSHFIAELEIIKKDLLEIWDKLNNEEK